jgi:hypothetical protein
MVSKALTPKGHVLKALSWYYWMVMEPLRGRF